MSEEESDDNFDYCGDCGSGYSSKNYCPNGQDTMLDNRSEDVVCVRREKTFANKLIKLSFTLCDTIRV